MPFELLHVLVSKSFKPSRVVSGDEAVFKVEEEGRFQVLFPGRVLRGASASFLHRFRVDPVDLETGVGGPRPSATAVQGRVHVVRKVIPLTFRVFSPDGREFNATEITLADLRRFRDLRGNPKPWSYRLTGESERILVDEDSSVVDPKASFSLKVLEAVANESAPPLVDHERVGRTGAEFKFDLFRVGTFVADVSLLLGAPWRGTMRLIDPDGATVAQTTTKRLQFAVDLPVLNRSRDAAGRTRKWTLAVAPRNGALIGTPRVSATVIAAGRVKTEALRKRIDALLGPDGSFIEIFGENKGGDAIGRLRINDVVAAETLDMHDLLDGLERAEGVPADSVEAGVLYTVGSRSEKLRFGLKLDVSSLKVTKITVDIGPGVRLGATVPAVKLKVAVSGAAKIKLGFATLATAKVRGGVFDLEVGIKLGLDGVAQVVTAMPDSPFDIDITAAAAVTLQGLAGITALVAGFSFSEYFEHEINETMVAGVKKLFSDPALGPRVLMTVFGGHFTYKPFRFEGPDVVFDHVAPVEADPRPSAAYRGAIGREVKTSPEGVVRFEPPQADDTWSAENLAKIEHVVVVMMENRSYDHVLGYRRLDPLKEAAEGLTPELIAAIRKAPGGPFACANLHDAKFAKNEALLMTRIPKSVGHTLRDVAEQLSTRAAGPDGRPISGPKGFVDNFKKHLTFDPRDPKKEVDQVAPDDVLGFYDQRELPFFAYLAQHYAYCDRYFCSHPGPTLPNRMFSLTGDVQHDRYGFPIVENNDGDNFLLSRAPNVFDLMKRRGLPFRVYESEPSVTMLRFFARYATDATDIVPVERFAIDVAKNRLPPFSMIEPQLHGHPQDDDHPDADMLRGQIFLQKVYETLRSNPATWRKTLLVITYDEHGGFYDHVVPPIADVYQSPRANVLGQLAGVLNATTTFTTRPSGGGAVGAGTIKPPRGVTVLKAKDKRAPLAIATGVRPQLTTAAPVVQVPYGVRVPTFLVSPWTVPGPASGKVGRVFDHCSILKTVLARFWGGEKPFLSDRVHASFSFDEFLTSATPRMDVPPSPSLPQLSIGVRKAPSPNTKVVTRPLTRKRMRQGPVDYHELSGRWARQLGR